MLVKTYAAALQSIQARTVTIEVSCTRGSYFQLVGLPDTAIKESQDRIISAIESSGYKFPGKRIVINIPITSDSFQAFKVGRKIIESDGNLKGLGQ